MSFSLDGQDGDSYFNEALKKDETATSDYISFYQKYISGIRGKACPMYPSCSNFGLKAFSERSFPTAFVLTSDRLLRCGHDHSHYGYTMRPSGIKYLDYPSYDKPPSHLLYEENQYYFAFGDTMPDTESLIFVKKLINTGFYREALLEILRLEHEHSTLSLELYVNKIICLRAMDELEKALFDFATQCPVSFREDPELLYNIALVHYDLENIDESHDKNCAALEYCEDCLIRPKLIKLQGLILAHKEDWDAAQKAFGMLQDFPQKRTLLEANNQVLNEARAFEPKSPALAGFLSIIPGAGYAYAGHKQTAISSLLVNGVLAYATYSNIKNENYGMAVLTGIFNLTFYVGNIQGAVSSAKRYNSGNKKATIEKLEYYNNL